MKNKQTTFYLVRHGETDWNVKRIIQGQTDIPLNPEGEKQAKALAEKFKNITFDLAFSSDLLRAKRTTEVVAMEHKLVVQTTNMLRERRFGTLEGQPSKLFFAYIELLNRMSKEERFGHKLNETYETDEVFTSRVITFLREAAVANPGKTILIGAHGGVLHMMLMHLGLYTYQDSDKLRFKNTGYIKLTSDGVEFQLQEIYGAIQRDFTNKQNITL